MIRLHISPPVLFVSVTLALITGCGDTPDLGLRDGLRVQLAEEQAALARYEAEHREWATETIEKMKKLVETLPAETAEFPKAHDKQEVDAFIAERKKELELLTEEMESSPRSDQEEVGGSGGNEKAARRGRIKIGD